MMNFLVVNFNKGETTKKTFNNYPAAERYFIEAANTEDFEILTLMNDCGVIYEKVTTL